MRYRCTRSFNLDGKTQIPEASESTAATPYLIAAIDPTLDTTDAGRRKTVTIPTEEITSLVARGLLAVVMD